jgi:hypothetical protein
MECYNDKNIDKMQKDEIVDKMDRNVNRHEKYKESKVDININQIFKFSKKLLSIHE